MSQDSKLNNRTTHALISKSFERLQTNLEGYGNTLNEKQGEALRTILELYSDVSRGAITGRFACPLPTGMGKTQSIVAFLATLVEMGCEQIGVAVCASKVEALCDLKRDLVHEGVPDEKIGLVHSYQFDQKIAEDYVARRKELPSGHASLPTTINNNQRQILLLTHQRVKGSEDLREFNIYRGKDRNLIIWDETLIASKTFTFEDDQVASAIGSLAPLRRNDSPMRRNALDYLSSCLEIVRKEMDRQASDKELGSPRPIRLPCLSESQIENYKAALGEGDAADTLRALLEASQDEFRVLMDVEQGGGVLTFNVVVPRDLKNIVILDASHNIRALARMDRSIRTVDLHRDIVSYENVTVHQLRHASGRNAMQKEFGKRRGHRDITREIIEVIKGIPEDEGVLIFVFKKKYRVDYRKTLLNDLRDAGVDTEAEINGKPRIVVLTWGNETSISHYSYCSNIIFAGVLHRSHLDIGSAICGQKQDLLARLRNDDIRRVIQSEVVHSIYQGMSRGSCRVIEGSKTKPMKVWLIHPGDIRHLIYEVMPGIRWAEWESLYLSPRVQPKADLLAETIRSYLGQLQGVNQMSISRLKKTLEMNKVHKNTMKRALEKALEGSGWIIKGRSVVRSYAYYFGQTPGEDSRASPPV